MDAHPETPEAMHTPSMSIAYDQQPSMSHQPLSSVLVLDQTSDDELPSNPLM
jgi:hypothetical protein